MSEFDKLKSKMDYYDLRRLFFEDIGSECEGWILKYEEGRVSCAENEVEELNLYMHLVYSYYGYSLMIESVRTNYKNKNKYNEGLEKYRESIDFLNDNSDIKIFSENYLTLKKYGEQISELTQRMFVAKTKNFVKGKSIVGSEFLERGLP